MSDWNDADEVTTTYGTIQLAQKQAYEAGRQAEREAIIETFELLPRDMDNSYGLDLATKIVKARTK